jgi:hypothetical protein
MGGENMISKYNKRQPILSSRISKQTNKKCIHQLEKKLSVYPFFQRALRGVRNGLPTKKAHIDLTARDYLHSLSTIT